MSLQPTLLKTKKKSSDEPTKWCVYFDEDNGDVITVTNKPKETIQYPFLRSTSEDAKRILMGEIDPKKFAVVELTEGFQLIERNDVIRIKQAENFLTNIPVRETNSDVNIVFYINSWKMEVNFNQETLYKMTGRRQYRDLSINPDSQGVYDKIVLYLIKENDPNFFIDTIEIDPVQLIQEGFLMYDLSNLRNIAGLGEINVLTKKIFKEYGIKRKSYFVNADFSSRHDKKRNELKVSAKDSAINTTFTIIKRDDSYWIRSNFVNPHESQIYTNVILYVIDKNNPNKLLEPFFLPIDDIGYNKEIYLRTDEQLENCSFIAKDDFKNISFDIINEESI